VLEPWFLPSSQSTIDQAKKKQKHTGGSEKGKAKKRREKASHWQ
jgi:hypothetical protein